MTSNRSHQADISFENAVIEIINHKGSQFSPEAVDVFVKSIHQLKVARDKMRDGTCEYLKSDPICYLPQYANISLEKIAG
jgi:HD-GYP domain-containing protein (c-di-GMP phosphodiesterase class II)